jgi:hypothetical protein
VLHVDAFQVRVQQHGGPEAPDPCMKTAVLYIENLNIKGVKLVKQDVSVALSSFADINTVLVQKIKLFCFWQKLKVKLRHNPSPPFRNSTKTMHLSAPGGGQVSC